MAYVLGIRNPPGLSADKTAGSRIRTSQTSDKTAGSRLRSAAAITADKTAGAGFVDDENDGVNTEDPGTTQKLVFIHHSTGQNMLDSWYANLGGDLGDQNYRVSNIQYGWDATANTDIGDYTDYGQMYWWFLDTTLQSGTQKRVNILNSVYAHNGVVDASYTQISNPGGENKIIMWKSCFTSADIRNTDSSTPDQLYGQSGSSVYHTLGNIQDIFRDVRDYLKTITSKMFIFLTGVPDVTAETTSTYATNAQSLATWLMDTWLQEDSWLNKNIYVFDSFNVWTHADHHHRVTSGAIDYVRTPASNYMAYGSGTNDSHPTQAGSIKACTELQQMINVFWHRWQHYLGNE